MKARMTKIGQSAHGFKEPPVPGARPVYWWIAGEWVHKGWLMPELP